MQYVTHAMQYVTHAMQYVTHDDLGWAVKLPTPNGLFITTPPLPFPKNFSPSTRWAQAGPLLQAEMMENGMSLSSIDHERGKFAAYYWSDDFDELEGIGPTPLIAAMRALVQRKLGDEVDVPYEFVEVQP